MTCHLRARILQHHAAFQSLALSIAADVQVVTSMFCVGTNATEYTFETCLALFQALHILVVRVYAKLLFHN